MSKRHNLKINNIIIMDLSQIKHMSKQINSLSEQLNVLKNVKEKANIFSLNNKKQEIENETD